MKIPGVIVELAVFSLFAAALYLPYHFFGGAALLKLLGFVLLVATVKESHGWKGALIAGGAAIGIYFFFGMPIVHGISLLIGLLFIILALGSIVQLFNLEKGSGSLLTVLVLGVPILLILGSGLLWFGLDGFDYFQPVLQWLDM